MTAKLKPDGSRPGLRTMMRYALESELYCRVFIREVFRFEELGFEELQEDFYKVFFRDVEIGEFDAEALRFRPVQVLR